MAKGPRIRDEVKGLIGEVYFAHPDWRAKEIRHEVNRRLGSDSPGLSAVQKQLTKMRRREAETGQDVRDRPWDLGSLTEHDLPPEAIPRILSVQEMREESGQKPLTVREAWWVSRLSAVIKNTRVLPVAEVLGRWANMYSVRERVCVALGRPVETSYYDAVVGRYAEEYAAYPASWDRSVVLRGGDLKELGDVMTSLLDLRSSALKRKLSEEEQELLDSCEQNEREAKDASLIELPGTAEFPRTMHEAKYFMDKSQGGPGEGVL